MPHSLFQTDHYPKEIFKSRFVNIDLISGISKYGLDRFRKN